MLKKYKEQIKASKDVIKKIDAQLDTYFGKIDTRQGITRNAAPTVTRRWGLARSYVASRKGNLTATETQLIKQFTDAFNEALKTNNAFFENDWKTYRAQVEKITHSPFKETKSFSMN